MKTQLKISGTLSLPIEAATDSIAILAKKNMGKTYTGNVVVEELLAAGVQTIVLDPMDVWWGLRAAADGREKGGYPIVIVGGRHADLPIDSVKGKEWAGIVVETGHSFVFCTRQMSKGERRRFVTDFNEELYRQADAHPAPRHVVFEEVDTIAPQRLPAGDERLFGSVDDIVRRGRSSGLGSTMITQRAAVANKNILSQAGILIVMGMTSPHDIAAIDDWVKEHGDKDAKKKRDELVATIPFLQQGEAIVWIPEHGIFEKVKIRKRRTFDSSATPKVGKIAAAPKTLRPLDMDKLREQLGEAIEKAKENDPEQLKRRIRELEAAAKKAPKLGPAAPAQASARDVERAVAAATREGDRKLRELSRAHAVEREALAATLAQEREAKDEAIGALLKAQSTLFAESEHLLEVATRIGARRGVELAVRRLEKARAARAALEPAVTPDMHVTPAARGKGNVKLAHASPETRLAFKFPPVEEHFQPIAKAKAAKRTAAAEGSIPVKAGARRMLQALAQYHPRTLSRVQVGLAAGITASGGTGRDYFSALHRNGYIEYVDAGRVAITADGLAFLGDDVPERPSSIDELQKSWRSNLKAGAARMFDILVSMYPEGVTRDALEEKADVHGGTFRDYLSVIRRLELIEEDHGIVRASRELFELAEAA